MADSVNTAGSLKFDTRIDTSGFERGTTDLKRSMERFKSSLKGVSMAMDGAFGGPSSKVIDLGNKIRQTERELENLRMEMEKIQNTPYVSTAFEDMQRQVDRTEAKMRELLNQRELLENNMREEFASLGFKDTHAEEAFKANPEWKKLSSQIDQAEQSLTRYEAQLEQIRRLDAGTDVKETADYRKRAEEYRKLADKLDVYKARLGEVQRAEQKASKGSRDLGSSMKKASGDSKKLNRSMNRTKKSASGLSKTLGMLKMSIIMSFAFRGIQAAMNGVTEGLQNLSQYSKPVNADMSALMSSMTQLKNAFATAFAPILSVVVPALNSLISVLVSACNAVGQFFAALTGHTTFTKSVKVQEDYAESLKKTGSAAKQAGKDAERSLMGFDAINKLSDNKAASGGGYEGPKPGDMFETVEINPKVLEAVEKFKNVLQKLKKAAQPTVDALKRLKKALEPLEKFAVRALLDFYNDFLKPVGKWTLGKGLLRLIDALAEGIGKVNWKRINSGLSKLWKALAPFAIKVGEGLLWCWENVLVPLGAWVLNNAVPLFLDILAGALDVLNATAEKLEPAWSWLWNNLFLPAANFVGDGIVMFLQAISDGLRSIKEAIENTPLSTLVSTFAGIGAALLAVNFSPAVAGIMDFLGKSTLLQTVLSALGTVASTVFSPAGAIAVGIGLLVGTFADLYQNSESFRASVAELGATWQEALQPLADFVGGALTDAWEQILKPAISFFVKTLLPNLITTCKNLWKDVLVPLGNFIGTVLQPVFKVLGDILSSLWKNIILPLAKAIGGTLKEAWDAIYKILNVTVLPIIRTVITTLTSLWKNVVNPIINVLWKNLKPAFDTVFKGIGTVIKGLKTTLSGIIKFISGVFTGDWKKAWTGIKDIFKGIFDSFVGIVKTPIKFVVDILNGLMRAIAAGINTVIDGINAIHIKMPDWLGGKSIGFNLDPITAPQIRIPALATGAVIPPNAPFLAMLGDQRHGKNIEAPLGTIEQALENVINRQGDRAINITLKQDFYLSGKKVTDEVVKQINQETMMTGNCRIRII